MILLHMNMNGFLLWYRLLCLIQVLVPELICKMRTMPILKDCGRSIDRICLLYYMGNYHRSAFRTSSLIVTFYL